jgi:hypothetical protein
MITAGFPIFAVSTISDNPAIAKDIVYHPYQQLICISWSVIIREKLQRIGEQ